MHHMQTDLDPALSYFVHNLHISNTPTSCMLPVYKICCKSLWWHQLKSNRSHYLLHSRSECALLPVYNGVPPMGKAEAQSKPTGFLACINTSQLLPSVTLLSAGHRAASPQQQVMKSVSHWQLCIRWISQFPELLLCCFTLVCLKCSPWCTSMPVGIVTFSTHSHSVHWLTQHTRSTFHKL